MTGGVPRNIGGIDAGYVRGGAEAAAYFEWGREKRRRVTGICKSP